MIRLNYPKTIARIGANVLLIAVGLSFAFSVTTARAEHPFHVSLAEIELNSESNCFEVAVGLWPADIEKTLSEQLGTPIDFDKTPEKDRDALLNAYIKSRFKMTDGKGKSGKLNWFGHEFDSKVIWVFFEVEADKEPLKWSIENQILFELNEAQLNQHSIKVGKVRISISARIDSAKHALAKQKDDTAKK